MFFRVKLYVLNNVFDFLKKANILSFDNSDYTYKFINLFHSQCHWNSVQSVAT
jgi:hypothetical protein